jgi:hypothetical protein
MVVNDAIRTIGLKLAGSFLVVGLLGFAIAAPGVAQANPTPPTSCFDRAFGDADRVNDTITPDPGPGGPYPGETGNYLSRIDTFDFNALECEEPADIYGLSIVIKNPFDIEGPDNLVPGDATNFNALVAELSTSVLDGGAGFEDYDHWTGWALPESNTFDENQAGFHGVSVCVWIGEDVATDDAGETANMEACAAGSVPRFALNEIVPGMVYSLSVFEALGVDTFGTFCEGLDCSGDDPLQIAVVAYSNVYGNTSGVYSHPEAVIGYLFEPISLVPEPSAMVLLGSGLAALAWRRRRRA